MSNFSEANLVKKLSDLNPSQQSIQTLSLWLIHHRKHSKTIVDVWLKELKKAKPKQKLTYLYLANDVVQNSKKKGPEFSRDFKTVLPYAYKHTASESDDKIKQSMDRLVKIWAERNVFEGEFTKHLKNSLVKAQPKRTVKAPKAEKKDEPPPKKKKKGPQTTLLEEIKKELSTEIPRGPPESEVLIKALEDLENSASSDAAVRERIASLPPEVSDASLLGKLADKREAEKLEVQVEEARSLLSNYNSRLADELEERKRVARLLRDYIHAQKEALTDSENKLQEYQAKLEKVAVVRKELKSHIQSLPDLTLLPDMQGLAPLPAAGDLFNIDKELGID